MTAMFWGQITGFFAWWGQELLGLLPAFLFASRGASLPKRVLSVESDGLRLIEPRAGKGQINGAGSGETVPVTEMIGRLAGDGTGKTAEVGLRLPYQACFVRRVELPGQAARDFPRLLALDLERATPFKPKDVRSAYYLDDSKAAPGKVAIRQLVIKRSAVNELIANLVGAGLKVVRLDCWNEDGSAALPVNFLEEATAGGAAGSRGTLLPKLLGGTAALLAASAAYLAIDRHEAALSELQTQTTQMKGKVQALRDASARSQVLMSEVENFRRLRISTPSKVAALEELTRLLPDTAWVTDLKIDGSSVDISGLASSAITLIPILERSAFFVDATSTAPLTFDQREDKERFSIRVRIRNTALTEAGKSAEAPK